MRFLVAAMMFTSGCDYILGLSHIGPRGPQEDKGIVAGTYQQHWIENDASGEPTAHARGAPLAELTATVVLDDGSARDVTWVDDENFTFTTVAPGDRYTFEVRSPFVDTSYELAVADPILVERFPGRIDRDPVVPGTTLALTITNRPAGTPPIKDEVHTTGLWSRTQIAVMPDGKSFSLDWATVTTDGVMGVLAAPDQLYYAHYSNTGAYIRLDAYAQKANAALTSGQTTSYTMPATLLAMPFCKRIKAAVDTESQRVATLAAGGAPFAYYAVAVTPTGGEYIASTSVPLAYQVTASTAPLDAMLSYANPYLGVDELTQINVAAEPTTDSLLYSSTLATAATTTCTNPVTTVTGVVALPTAAAIGGVSLTTDGVAIALPATAPLEVTWTPSQGSVDYWIVRVIQVLGTAAITKLEIVTLEPRATFDAARLSAGKTYRVEIEARVGSPGGQAGHFDMFDPHEVQRGVLDTTTFVPQ